MTVSAPKLQTNASGSLRTAATRPTLPSPHFEGPRPEPALPSLDVACVLKAIEGHAPAIQARAQENDLTGDFPGRDVALLQELGAFRIFASDAVGADDLMKALRLIGRCNLSLGRIFEGHVNAALLIRRYGSRPAPAGAIMGVWNTEADPGCPVAIDEAGRLVGRKSYATGAGRLDFAVVTGTSSAGARQMVLVDASDVRRTDLRPWRVSGMRSTGSGIYDLTGLPAGPAERVGGPDDYLKEPTFSGGAWRFAAVQLGGAERVLKLTRDHLLKSGPCGAVQMARFGDAVARVRSAYFWVQAAARQAEAPDAGEDAVAAVLMARRVVEEAGLGVVEAAARLVGTRAFFDTHPLDHACRDLALYLRQPAPDAAFERAARAFLERDRLIEEPLW